MALKGILDWLKGEEMEGDFDDYEEAPKKRTQSETPSYVTPEPSETYTKKPNDYNQPAQLAVVLVKPDRFENAAEIADHLKDRRTVVLNLEQTVKDVSRRLVDFLSGVAYANEGKIKRVANSTFIITPYNVDLMGDLIDELENGGLYI